MNRRAKSLLILASLALLLTSIPPVVGCGDEQPSSPGATASASVSEETAAGAVSDTAAIFEGDRLVDGISPRIATGLVAASVTQVAHLARLGGDSPAGALSWLSRRSPLQRRLLVGFLSAAMSLGLEWVSEPIGSEGSSNPSRPDSDFRLETPCV